ncbi:hypothetical protein HMPREF9141_2572 [Prevotella multiformis DSM 16608]|uniref:Uncharacterized protein n=1 Tax=Prevotella multiformis DSM 16608 TaxID=888743 RepID=F0FAF5_9BACT|nr:hypothetical protein HMPREF9141_2572 [Prevotella multiformis DSM 16608]
MVSSQSGLGFPTAGNWIPSGWEQESRPVGNSIPCAGGKPLAVGT